MNTIVLICFSLIVGINQGLQNTNPNPTTAIESTDELGQSVYDVAWFLDPIHDTTAVSCDSLSQAAEETGNSTNGNGNGESDDQQEDEEESDDDNGGNSDNGNCNNGNGSDNEDENSSDDENGGNSDNGNCSNGNGSDSEDSNDENSSSNGNCSTGGNGSDSEDSNDENSSSNGSCSTSGNNDDDDNDDDDNDNSSGNGSCGNGGNSDDDDNDDDDNDDDDNDNSSGNGSCGNGGNSDDDDDDNDDEDSDDDDNDNSSGNGNCGNGDNNDDDDDNDNDDEESDEDDNDNSSGNGSCGNGGNNDDDDDDNDDEDNDDEDSDDDDNDNDDEDSDDDDNDNSSGNGNCGNGGNNDDDDDDNDDDDDDNDDEDSDDDDNEDDDNEDNDGDDNDNDDEDDDDNTGSPNGVTCPSDAVLNCGSSTAPEFNGQPIAPAGSTITFTDEYLSTACPVILVRHWVISLSDGTGTFCDQTITVEDVEAPVITLTSTAITSCDDLNNLQYTVTDCDPNPVVTVDIATAPVAIDCTIDGYRSQTQGGWGAQPNGNNPGVYLHTHFAQAFPNGLTIGCDNSLTLASAQAITDFLPSGSTPSMLPAGNLIDPGNGYNNVLAGQLVAATLNVTFDSYDPNFGSSSTPFAQLIIAQGPFQGITVSELLLLANAHIGGCNSNSSSSALNAALTALNENFVDGTTNNGYFICPDAVVNTGNPSSDCVVNVIYTITATDHCGNSSSIGGNLTYTDSQAPVFIDAPTDIYLECGDSIPMVSATDDCGAATISISFTDTEFSGACIPTIERTYVAVDACGNSATFVQYIHIDDTQAPVISGIESVLSLSCADLAVLPEPAITDACGEPIVTYSESGNINNCSGTRQRTWTATDACGNSSSFTQTVVVSDAIAPVFQSIPAAVTLPCGSAVPTTMATATDNCGAATVTVQQQVNSTAIGCQTITRVFTATDACGNTATASQIVTFTDAIPPVFNTIPADLTLNCGSTIPNTNVTATDNCDNAVAVTMSEDYFFGDCETIITRTWIATDNCGNMQMADQIITLIDNTPPVFAMPAVISATCTSVNNLTPNVSDNCSADIIITHQDVTNGQGCSYQIVRTYTATDLCGNSAQFVQTINVADTQGPVFTMVPASFTTACTSPAPPTAPIATDNCTPNVPVTMTEVWSGSGCSQQVVRTWTATDACGNSTSVSQTVVISDNQPPVILGVPQSYTASCQNFQYPAVPTTITVSDNCSSQTTLQFQESTVPGNCDGSYTIIRTWTATDQCGNTAVANQSITVADTQAPVWSGNPAPVQIACGSPLPAIPVLTATDNCTVDPFIDYFEFEESTDCGQLITRFWSATDACGNTSTRTQVITVTDGIAPVIVANALANVSATCTTIPNAVAPTVTDNCSAVDVAFNEVLVLDGCPYHIVRTWTATDGCGNTSSWTQTIAVSDIEAPVLGALPQDIEVSCDAIPAPSNLSIVDCSDVTLEVEETTTIGSCPSNYDILRIYTATDLCGNVSSHAHTIHVVDNEAPILINVPADMMVECGTTLPVPNVSAVDNCQNNVTVQYTETITDVPNAPETCQLTTPDAIFGDVALWLPGLNGIGANYVFTGSPSMTVNHATGTAIVQAEVANTMNADYRWSIELHLVNGQDWTSWSALGRTYKDDLGVAANYHQSWMYYELVSTSSATGLGALAGSTLQFTHAPATFYYGFQMGERANNRNLDYGISGWLFYNGTVNGTQVNGHGDFFATNDCCQPQTIERTWTATDCAGNTVSHTQTIAVGGNATPLTPSQPQPVLPELSVSYAGDETFRIAFKAVKSGRTTLELYSLQGQLISTVYNGVMQAGEEVNMQYPMPHMRNANYFFKLVNVDQVKGTQSMMMR